MFDAGCQKLRETVKNFQIEVTTFDRFVVTEWDKPAGERQRERLRNLIKEELIRVPYRYLKSYGSYGAEIYSMQALDDGQVICAEYGGYVRRSSPRDGVEMDKTGFRREHTHSVLVTRDQKTLITYSQMTRTIKLESFDEPGVNVGSIRLLDWNGRGESHLLEMNNGLIAYCNGHHIWIFGQKNNASEIKPTYCFEKRDYDKGITQLSDGRVVLLRDSGIAVFDCFSPILSMKEYDFDYPGMNMSCLAHLEGSKIVFGTKNDRPTAKVCIMDIDEIEKGYKKGIYIYDHLEVLGKLTPRYITPNDAYYPSITAITVTECGEVVTGDNFGNLYVWDRTGQLESPRRIGEDNFGADFKIDKLTSLPDNKIIAACEHHKKTGYASSYDGQFDFFQLFGKYNKFLK